MTVIFCTIRSKAIGSSSPARKKTLYAERAMIEFIGAGKGVFGESECQQVRSGLKIPRGNEPEKVELINNQSPTRIQKF